MNSEDNPEAYHHIGHADPNDKIWIWKDEKLKVTTAGMDCHETLYGKECNFLWRGRYEVKTQKLSLLVPQGATGWKRFPPDELKEALELEFGTDDIHYFNPRK
jgi:hypothetical protein